MSGFAGAGGEDIDEPFGGHRPWDDLANGVVQLFLGA